MENLEENVETLINLVNEKKYSVIKEKMTEINAFDMAEIYDELPENMRPLIYRMMPKELAADVFMEMDSEHREDLVRLFSDKELREVLNELYMDDTVDVIEEMPAGVVQRILKNTDPATRKAVNELLKYPASSAGSIMTTEFVLLKENWLVSEAFERIRRDAIDKETIYTCYVTDKSRKLIGIVSAKDLLLADPSATVSSIMIENVISVETMTDQEEVAHMFEDYDFLAMPVVDKEKRLVGIVTVDDAMDVLHEEVEEDFAKMAAITPTEEPYLKTSALKTYLSRIPWLLLLMISATFTGTIISGFESALSVCVVLTAFIPMIMDTGGNSGSQASVTIIRGLSLGEIEFRDIGKVIWKEFRVAILCGLSLGIVSYLKVYLLDYLALHAIESTEQPAIVALVVACTLCVTVICAKLIGCLLPILAKKIGFDPAVMASPFITTVVDAVSLIVYFQIASAILIPLLN